MNGSIIAWPFSHAPLQSGWTAQGIAWAVCANPMGTSLNGYAQIPAESHPWCRATDYGEVDELLRGNRHAFAEELTFGVRDGWVGFDTAHAFDLWSDDALVEAGVTPDPLYGEFRALTLRMAEGHPSLRYHWWTGAEVVAVAQALAACIADVKP